jgi:hypothetical protein
MDIGTIPKKDTTGNTKNANSENGSQTFSKLHNVNFCRVFVNSGMHEIKIAFSTPAICGKITPSAMLAGVRVISVPFRVLFVGIGVGVCVVVIVGVGVSVVVFCAATSVKAAIATSTTVRELITGFLSTFDGLTRLMAFDGLSIDVFQTGLLA